MPEERIDSIIVKEAIEKEIKFLSEGLTMLEGKITNFSKIRISVEGAKGFKEVGDAQKSLNKETTEAIKLQNDIEKTYRKRIALEQENAKLLAQEKEALRQRNNEIKNSIREQQAAAGSIEQMRARLISLQKEYDNLGEAERNSESGTGLRDKIKSLSDNLKKLEGDTGRHQRSVGNYSIATNILKKSLDDVNRKLSENANSNKLSADAVNKLQREQQLLTQFLERQEAAFTSASQEIRENTKQLQLMEQAGLQATEAYKLLFAETSRLKDETADLKTALKNAAPDDVAFEGAAQAARGLVGVYGLAKSTAAAFGIENEALQETLVKLQAAETALQSIEAIRVALKKESAFRQAINIGLQKVQVVQTNLETAAQSRNVAVRYSAIAAQKALNVVMGAAGGPILAVIGVLALLAISFDAFGGKVANAKKSMQQLNDEFDEGRKALDKYNNSVKRTSEVLIAQLDAEGKTNEIRKETLSAIDKQIAATKEKIKVEKKSAEDAELYVYRQKKGIIGLVKENLEANKKRVADYDALKEALLDLEAERSKKVSEFNKADREKAEAEAKKKKEDHKKDGEERIKEQKDIAERERKAQFELLKLSLEDQIKLQQASVQNSELPSQLRLNALQKEIDLKKTLLYAERNFQLDNEKNTDSERLLINAKYLSDIQQLERDNAKAVIEILRQAGEDQKAAEVERLQKRIETLTNGLENELAISEKRESDLLSKQAQHFADGLIDFETYQRNKARIERSGIVSRLNEEIRYFEDLIELYGVDEKTRIDAERKISALKKQLHELDVEQAKEANEKKKGFQDEFKVKIKEIGNELVNLTSSLFSGGVDREKNRIQEQIDLIEQRKQAEIEAINATALSEQEKADKIAVLNARAAAQKEQLEQRQRELDYRKAKFEKQITIARIIADNAAAVVAALGAKPFTAENIAKAFAVGSIGALQLATAIAAPLPKFSTGTDDAPGGWALTDEKGPELYVEPSGKTYLGNPFPTLRDLIPGTKIFPAHHEYTKMFVNSTRLPQYNGSSVSDSLMRKNIEVGEMSLQEQQLTRKAIKDLNLTVINKIETSPEWAMNIYNAIFK